MHGQPTIKGIGFNTQSATGDFSRLDQLLGRFTEAGCTYAEITLSACDLIAGGQPIRPQVRRLAEICHRHRLGYTAHAPLRINFFDTDHLEVHVAVARASVAVAAEIGADLVNLHTGFAASNTWLSARARVVEQERLALADLAGFAQRHGVRLSVENIYDDPSLGHVLDPFELARHLTEVGHPNLGATIDFSHAFLMARRHGFDYAAGLRALAPLAHHLHLIDCFGDWKTLGPMSMSDQMAYGMGDLHLPPGWGGIDWDAALADLPVRPGTVIILEVQERFWPVALAECLDTARTFAARLDAQNRR